MRNLTKAFAAVSLLAPVTSYSLGVGGIQLHSSLNQKLRAEIPLVVSAAERKNIKNIKVRLAPPAKFDAEGIKWNYFLSKIRFKTKTKSNGKVVIQLSSNSALKEPFLDFLVEVNWPSGKLYREFTVLVDPPKTYAKAKKTPKPTYAKRQSTNTPPAKTPHALKQSFVAERNSDLIVEDLSNSKNSKRVSNTYSKNNELQIIDKDGSIRETTVAIKEKSTKKYKKRVHTKFTPKKHKPKNKPKAKVKVTKKYTPKKHKPKVKVAKKYTPKNHKAKLNIARKYTPKTKKRYTAKKYKAKVKRQYKKRSVRPAVAIKNNIYGPTRRNTSLSYVASKTNRYRNVSAKQMMLALYKANPDAFYEDNVNALEVGQRLTIPSKEEILRISRSQATAEYQAHENRWRGIVSPDDITPPENLSSEPVRQKTTPQLVLKAPDETEISDQAEIVTPKKSAPSSEEAKKLSDNNQDLKIRLEKLTKQLESIQQIIVLKDKELALLKKSLTLKNSEKDKVEQKKIEDELKKTDDAIKASALKLEADKAKTLADEEAKKLEADKAKTLADEEAKKLEADKAKTLADEEAKKLEADKAKTLADEEAKKLEADKAKTLADEEAKKLEADKAKTLADEEAKKLEADKAKTLADEEAKKLEADKAKTLADEEAKKLEAEKAKTLADEEAKKLAETNTTETSSLEDDNLITDTAADLGVPEDSENRLLKLKLKEPKSQEDLDEIERLKKLNPTSEEAFDFTPELELPDNFSFSNILNDPYYRNIVGGGSVFLLFFAWLFFRRRKNQETTEVESMFTESSEIHLPNNDDDFKVESLDNNSFLFGGESSFLNNNNDFDAFDDDKDDIDSISEADVYLAYGRYQQAEELMRQAINDQPDRDECKLKLLEIFVANGDEEKVEKYVQELADNGKNSDPVFWNKIIEMGQKTIPESPLLVAVKSDKKENSNKDEFKIEIPSFDHPKESPLPPSTESKINLEKQDDVIESLESKEKEALIKEPTTEDNNIDFDLSGFENSSLLLENNTDEILDDNSIDFDIPNLDKEKVTLEEDTALSLSAETTTVEALDDDFNLSDLDASLEITADDDFNLSDLDTSLEIDDDFNLSDLDTTPEKKPIKKKVTFNENEETISSETKTVEEFENDFDLSDFGDNASDLIIPDKVSEKKEIDLTRFDDDTAISDNKNITNFDATELDTENIDHEQVLSSKIEDLGRFENKEFIHNKPLLDKKEITQDQPNNAHTQFSDINDDSVLSSKVDDSKELDMTAILPDFEAEKSFDSIMSEDSSLLGDNDFDKFNEEIEKLETIDDISEESESNFDLSSFDGDVTNSIISDDIPQSEQEKVEPSTLSKMPEELESNFDLSDFDEDIANSITSDEMPLPEKNAFSLSDTGDISEEFDSSFDLSGFDEDVADSIISGDTSFTNNLANLDDESSILASEVNEKGVVKDNAEILNLADEATIITPTASDDGYIENDFNLLSLDDESSIIATGVDEQGLIEDNFDTPSKISSDDEDISFDLDSLKEESSIIASDEDFMDDDFDFSSLDEESSIISSGVNNQGEVRNKKFSNTASPKKKTLEEDAVDFDFDLSNLDEESSIITSAIDDNQGLNDYSGDEGLLASVENFDLSPNFSEDDIEETQVSNYDIEEKVAFNQYDNENTEPLGINNAISLGDPDTMNLGFDDDEDFENLDEMSVEETKIDLARAYLDMGDTNAAKSILNEILSDGAEKQKIIAKKLLDTL